MKVYAVMFHSANDIHLDSIWLDYEKAKDYVRNSNKELRKEERWNNKDSDIKQMRKDWLYSLERKFKLQELETREQ